jgi:hypothetical protein
MKHWSLKSLKWTVEQVGRAVVAWECKQGTTDR